HLRHRQQRARAARAEGRGAPHHLNDGSGAGVRGLVECAGSGPGPACGDDPARIFPRGDDPAVASDAVRTRKACVDLAPKESVMPWIYLLLAGLFEIGWAIGLKYTEGFSRLWPTVGTVAAMTASIILLALAVKTLPIGTAYAVWTGIGAVGAVILGIVLFGDPATALRLACIGLIVA